MPAVAGSRASFQRKIRATCENCRCAVSEPPGVLMNGEWQFGEDRPYFVGAFRSEGFSKFSDAVIEQTSAHTHTSKIQLPRQEDAKPINITIPTVVPYPESRRRRRGFAVKSEVDPEGREVILTFGCSVP